MAVIAHIETLHGEERPLYVRLNNVEVSNHGVTAHALFRGFISEEAFQAGKHFVWERQIEFLADVAHPELSIWQQAYAALKALPAVELPDEPGMPEPLADNASDEVKALHADRVAIHDAAMPHWHADCAKVEALNVLHGALAAAEDHL